MYGIYYIVYNICALWVVFSDGTITLFYMYDSTLTFSWNCGFQNFAIFPIHFTLHRPLLFSIAFYPLYPSTYFSVHWYLYFYFWIFCFIFLRLCGSNEAKCKKRQCVWECTVQVLLNRKYFSRSITIPKNVIRKFRLFVFV